MLHNFNIDELELEKQMLATGSRDSVLSTSQTQLQRQNPGQNSTNQPWFQQFSLL